MNPAVTSGAAAAAAAHAATVQAIKASGVVVKLAPADAERVEAGKIWLPG